MAPTLYDEKPQPGDLIEIDRGTYQHWAVYVGDGYVIHLVPPSEVPGAGASSVMSVLYDKALVKRERLWDVVGTDKWNINNGLDKKYEPRPLHLILGEAWSYVGMELPYCLFRGNCEHFVTELRYGKAESRQIRNAAAVGLGVCVVGFGVLALAAALSGGGSRERKNKQ